MLGEKLKKVREARNISQTKAAYDLKIGRQTLCNWENDYAQPSISKLEKLADYYNVSIDYLLDRDYREYLDVSGLTVEELAPIRQIISDLKKDRKSVV